MRHLALLIVIVPLCLLAVEKEQKLPASAQPTDDEVRVLNLLNDFRGDVARGQVPLVRLMQMKVLPARSALWARTMSKQKPAPPLVLNQQLMNAARTVLAGSLAPVADEHIPFADVFRAAGYVPEATGQVMIARSAVSLPVAFAAAMTQVVGHSTPKPGSTYTVPYFAAGTAVNPAWREVGIAVSITKDGSCSLVMVLGAGSAKRLVGGVVYVDSNRNLRCDAGEGQAGITINVGDAIAKSGPSGTWWLGLESDAAAELVFADKTHRSVRPLEQGAVNLMRDWRMPMAADLSAADRLIAEAEKDPTAEPSKRRKALAALLHGTRMAALDDARQTKVTTLTQPIQAEYDELLSQVMAILPEEKAEFKEHFAVLKKPWEGSMASLFKEFEALYALRQQVTAVLAAPEERQASMSPPVLKQVLKATLESRDPICLAQLTTWRESLENTLPVESIK